MFLLIVQDRAMCGGGVILPLVCFLKLFYFIPGQAVHGGREGVIPHPPHIFHSKADQCMGPGGGEGGYPSPLSIFYSRTEQCAHRGRWGR